MKFKEYVGESLFLYKVVIDDMWKHQKGVDYTIPMEKKKAEKAKKELEVQMKTAIPKYQFAKNIKVVKVFSL